MPRSWIFLQFFPHSTHHRLTHWVEYHREKKRGRAARKFVDYSTAFIHLHRTPFVPPRQQSSSCTDFHGWGFVAHLDRTAGTASRFIVTQECFGFYGGSESGFEETLHLVDVASREWWSAWRNEGQRSSSSSSVWNSRVLQIRALSNSFWFIWFLGKREATITGNDFEFVILREGLHWVISIISLTTSATDFPYVGMYEMWFSLECFRFSHELLFSV